MKKTIIMFLLIISTIVLGTDLVDIGYYIISCPAVRFLVASRLAIMAWNTLTLSPAIIEIDLGESKGGFTFGGIVFINSGLPPGKKRAAIAHEIIHCLQASAISAISFPMLYDTERKLIGYDNFWERMAYRYMGEFVLEIR